MLRVLGSIPPPIHNVIKSSPCVGMSPYMILHIEVEATIKTSMELLMNLIIVIGLNEIHE